jgi:hypothetical protein
MTSNLVVTYDKKLEGETKNDKAWFKIFVKYDILNKIKEDGYFEISADQIRDFREPRLMTKFDHNFNLPKIFSEYNLAILPISRSRFAISDFKCYQKLPTEKGNVKNFKAPENIQSLDFENVTSEAIAINCAYVSNILADFLEEENLVPTVNGRMGSGVFDFEIDLESNSTTNFKVKNSQIEIDGGFEGLSSFALVEAKISVFDDFLIRQMYYPYRVWKERIYTPKTVRNVFFMYSNGYYHLYEYEFDNPKHYNSLQLKKYQVYTLEEEEITLDDVLEIFNSVELVEEPEIPFPQADRFERVINICELLQDNRTLTNDEFTTIYSFDPRQTQYYTSVCRYLGLVETFKIKEMELVKINGEIKSRLINKTKFRLTEKGKSLFKLSFKKRNLEFVRLLLSHKAFYLCFEHFLKNLELPTKNETIEYMKVSDLYNVGLESNTIGRRSSTVRQYINWITHLWK